MLDEPVLTVVRGADRIPSGLVNGRAGKPDLAVRNVGSGGIDAGASGESRKSSAKNSNSTAWPTVATEMGLPPESTTTSSIAICAARLTVAPAHHVAKTLSDRIAVLMKRCSKCRKKL